MGQGAGSAGAAFLMKGSRFSEPKVHSGSHAAWYVTRDPGMASNRTLCQAFASPGHDLEKHMDRPAGAQQDRTAGAQPTL